MKTIQIIAEGKTRVVDTPKPVLKLGHILLKTAYVGFCGSDLNTFRGRNPMVIFPVVPGHEIGAVIEAVGIGVPNHLQPGMHATVHPYTSCGHCAACLKDRPNACAFNQTLGVQRDGAMSEYVLVPWEKVIANPDLSVRDLALVEPMSVGFHAVSRGEVTDSDTVLVMGCGMIGMGAVVGAAVRGAKVIAVDVDDKKLELAKRLGAQYSVNVSSDSLHDRLLEITRERGADVVIEAVGRPETYIASVSAAAFTGRVVCIGYARDQVLFDTQFFVKKELDIRGSRNALPKDFSAVMDYLKRGTCPLDDLITSIYPPEEVQTALEIWSANPGSVCKILIRF